jgi:hypothetical protein
MIGYVIFICLLTGSQLAVDASPIPEPTGRWIGTESGRCDVYLKSWGFEDEDSGSKAQIVVNGVSYIPSFGPPPANIPYRGITTMVVNPFECTATDYRHFDLYGIAADGPAFDTYLKSLSKGTILVGVLIDSSETYIGKAAATLKAMGVDVSGVTIRSKLLFRLQVGNPTKTLVKTAGKGGASLEHREELPDFCMNGGVVEPYEDFSRCRCSVAYTGVYCENINPNAGCLISAVVFGMEDTERLILASKLTVNEKPTPLTGSTNFRGISILHLDPCDCTLYGHKLFDTFGSAQGSTDLVSYLSNLRDGAVVVGVSDDEASSSLDPAKEPIKAFGVNLDALGYRHKVFFLIQKGKPDTTVQSLAPNGGNHLRQDVLVSGLCNSITFQNDV